MWRPLADEAALASAWREARPFAHVIVDDFAPDPDALLAVLEEEAVHPYESDLFRFEATAPEPTTAEFRALRAAFGKLYAPQLSRITGRAVTHADMRAFAYRPRHYLLPHADHQDGLERRLAYAYYLPSPEPPRGGELELYRCMLESSGLVGIASDRVIEPRANRIVIFEVSDVSLHQVREVLAGLRVSLAGWFYP